MNTPQPPKPRRRIAGEKRPGEATAAPPLKPTKPKVSKRPKPERAITTTMDLPAAPARTDSARVPRSKPPATLIGLIVLALVSVAFGAFGVWRGVDEWRGSNVTDAHADAADAAAKAVETIYSYRYDKLDAHLRASQATMTPRFAKQLSAANRVLVKLAPQRRTQVKSVTRYAAPTECGEDCSQERATVLVFFDMASTYADSDRPAVVSPRINVSMVERDGTWLVNNIKWL